jgi:two-component system response regulator YesN
MYKVLVVEDEELIRKGIIYTNDWASMNCVVAGEAVDGIDGMEKIREIQPDIVLTDLLMPRMDGLEMLRETIDTYHYATVVISGHNEFDLAQTAIHLGACEYILKPIETDSLCLAINRAKQLADQRRIYQQTCKEADLKQNIDLLADVQVGRINSRRVKAMLEYIHTHYSEKISIHDLTEPLSTSATYLNLMFRNETSLPFNEYLNRYRIMQALHQLQHGEDKVYVIAEKVGFTDYKYFISVFKKYVHSSPKKIARLLEQ